MGALKTLIVASALSLSTLCANGQQKYSLHQSRHKQQQSTQQLQQTPQSQQSLPLTPSKQLQKYLLPSGIPSKEGIDYYVENYDDSVLVDIQKRFGIELFIDLYFSTDSLGSRDDALDQTKYGNNKKNNRNEILVVMIPSRTGTEAGYYNNGEVVISDREIYFGYSRKTTSNKVLENIISDGKFVNIVSTNKFVRGAMIHEVIHGYTQQVIAELKLDSIPVPPEYRCTHDFCKTPGTKFIEEGIAEYCSIAMGEVILGEPYTPKNTGELLDEQNDYVVNYQYAPACLKKFLDNMGLHDGLKIILSNAPPTKEEMLDMVKYFSRLKLPGSELKLSRSVYQ